MSNSSWILVNLVVIASLVAFVSIEVDLLILALDVLKAEGLVPSLWEHVETDLATNTKLQVQFLELLLQFAHKGLSDLGSFVVLLKGITLVFGAVSADGRDVHHTIPVLEERASEYGHSILQNLPLNWDVQFGDILQREVDELL